MEECAGEGTEPSKGIDRKGEQLANNIVTLNFLARIWITFVPTALFPFFEDLQMRIGVGRLF